MQLIRRDVHEAYRARAVYCSWTMWCRFFVRSTRRVEDTIKHYVRGSKRQFEELLYMAARAASVLEGALEESISISSVGASFDIGCRWAVVNDLAVV